MSGGIQWIRVIELASLLGVTHLAGYQLASDRLALHALLTLDLNRQDVTRGWFRAWDFGRRYGPFMVIGSAIGFGLVAWAEGSASPAFPFHVAAAALTGAVGPYTQFVVFPINDIMLAEHKRVLKEMKDKTEVQGAQLQSVKKTVADWRRVDATRMVLETIALVAGYIAVLKG